MVKEFIEKVQNTKFDINETSSGLITLQQTQRNKLKQESLQVFAEIVKNGVADTDSEVFLTSDGVVLSIYNATIDQVINFVINPVIKSLDYDAEEEANAYLLEIAEKERKTEEKAKKKAEKIAKDKAKRENKG